MPYNDIKAITVDISGTSSCVVCGKKQARLTCNWNARAARGKGTEWDDGAPMFEGVRFCQTTCASFWWTEQLHPSAGEGRPLYEPGLCGRDNLREMSVYIPLALGSASSGNNGKLNESTRSV